TETLTGTPHLHKGAIVAVSGQRHRTRGRAWVQSRHAHDQNQDTPMIACLRPFSALCLAGLLVACAGSPSSSLGELPRTPQASIDQLLQQASQSAPEQAALLRLSAADQAWRQQDIGRATRILDEVSLDGLK